MQEHSDGERCLLVFCPSIAFESTFMRRRSSSRPPRKAPRSKAVSRHKVRKRGVLFGLLRLLGILLLLTLACGGGAYLYFSSGLPDPQELRTWRPPQGTKVFCSDGKLCAEYFIRRRTWIDVATLPPFVRDAFIAAEDSDFYQHQGLDFGAIFRSAIRNLRPGSMKSGASTISQQVCRNLLLQSTERKLSRKIRELILTPRMERSLTKDEILNLYMNSVDFGQGRNGLEEAALYYFGKSAAELSVGEAAVLAGIVQRPADINPVSNIVRAKKRQTYVLTQMERHGFISSKVAASEIARPIVLGPKAPAFVGAYYAEEVRRILVGSFGSKRVLEGGLRVQIAMDTKLQAAADDALRSQLETIDQRQGYRGPVAHLPIDRFAVLRPLFLERLEQAGRRKKDEPLIADLEALKDLASLGSSPLGDEADPDEPAPSLERRVAKAISIRTLQPGAYSVGAVVQVDDKRGIATVDLIGARARLRFEQLKWARKRDSQGRTSSFPTVLSQVVQMGDLVRVRLEALKGDIWTASLIPEPKVQGALVAIDPHNRHVVAMVGGYDFDKSSFNRATQARRQPGSAFKPFLYGAALESRLFTPASIINDAPEVVRDDTTGKAWKPKNYVVGSFQGGITLRAALNQSKNTVSVRLIEAIGPQAEIAFAKGAGIRSGLPENLTLALGTGEVGVLELANAYTTFQADGDVADPITVLKVTDPNGEVLEESASSPLPGISPPVAFLTTSLMRSVVEEGTARSVLELGRPAAGKTGTAQEWRDAWFSGFTNDLVATVWIGFDDHAPLGTGEDGARAALPAWVSFMKRAHEGVPVTDFQAPDGIVEVRIDRTNGLLAAEEMPGTREYFLAGTEPTESASAVDPNEFLLLDQGAQ